ncbi:hypothetical protein [Micromonospora sp. NPDC023737]|uniref:hypothetical protein n=1 Tax=unclassified Micromonospora TaxID=2617518 RepID=UPI0033D38E00
MIDRTRPRQVVAVAEPDAAADRDESGAGGPDAATDRDEGGAGWPGPTPTNGHGVGS